MMATKSITSALQSLKILLLGELIPYPHAIHQTIIQLQLILLEYILADGPSLAELPENQERCNGGALLSFRI
jgi:hypothetical protein